jgi:hypothetical protein
MTRINDFLFTTWHNLAMEEKRNFAGARGFTYPSISTPVTPQETNFLSELVPSKKNSKQLREH